MPSIIVNGEIVTAEYSSYWGVMTGTIRCCDCQEEIPVGGGHEHSRCRCGYEWSFDLSAIGTREDD